MKHTLFLLFLMFCLMPGLFSQTVIFGTAPGAEGKPVKISSPGDLITFYEIPLASAIVDAEGKFTLSIDLTETRYVVLSIQFHTAELFLEPDKTYQLKLAPINYDENREINPFIRAQSLQVEIVNPEQDDINIMIGDFNGRFDAFLVKNFNALYKERDRRKVDTLRHQIITVFGNVQKPYFRAYVDYKFASLEQLTQSQSQSQLAHKYFIGKPILYANLEYMDFFNSFFSKYLTATSKSLKFTDYLPIFKSPDPYQTLVKTMAKDTLLKDPQLRELVMLKGLLEFSNMQGYDKETVASVVKSVSELSSFLENREVAANMYKYMRRLKPGTDAPLFTLTDQNQQTVSLEKLRGKPVLLLFWSTYCEGCLSEMDILVPLFKRYGDRISFVAVATDREFIKMKMFLDMKRDYTWTFLHLGEQYDLLKDYDVRVYPLFVLIDREGKIYRYPAEFPDKGLERSLDSILSE